MEDYQMIIDDAITKYEHGESGIMSAYAVVRNVESRLLESVGDNKLLKRFVKLIAKTARIRIREVKLKKLKEA